MIKSSVIVTKFKIFEYHENDEFNEEIWEENIQDIVVLIDRLNQKPEIDDQFNFKCRIKYEIINDNRINLIYVFDEDFETTLSIRKNGSKYLTKKCEYWSGSNRPNSIDKYTFDSFEELEKYIVASRSDY
jgi:hypothetical protein